LDTAEQNISQLQTATTTLQGNVTTINNKIQTIQTELSNKEPLLTVEGNSAYSQWQSWDLNSQLGSCW
jgi:peptidoglycan hydrolase CwlO-like protein